MGSRRSGLNAEQLLVMALLRKTAQPTDERAAEVRTLSAAADPSSTLALLAELGVTAQLGRFLLDDPELALPTPVSDALRAARTLARHRGLFHYGLTVRLAGALEERGIAVVPLKGAALADSVYGDLGARESADIDLLVPAGGLDEAVEAVREQGWEEPPWAPPPGELPRLHRELMHAELPPLELHWRVHWYEESFAEAALSRAEATGDGWRRLLPHDELAFLLLFLARDGFAGLRQTVDVAAWWAALGGGTESAAEVHALAERHPELAPALTASARHVERAAGLPAGSLGDPAARLSPRQRAALRLANPWLAGSREQIDATVTLIDGLLGPPGGLGAFARRQLLPPHQVLLPRNPELANASPKRLRAARAGHALRLLARYVPALGSLAVPRRA